MIKKSYVIVDTPQEIVHLSFIQLMKATIFGRVNLGPRMKEGWTGPLDFWMFKCSEGHGWVVNNVSGGRNLRCPVCIADSFKEDEKVNIYDC